MTFSISMGIMAYNEEGTIGQLLLAALRERFTCGSLSEIIVVASGCTDRTEGVVREYERYDSRVRLFVQPHREGKASAVNVFLTRAHGDILILESGDTLPDEGTLDKLVAPFENSRVGMTGAHPVPVNRRTGFMNYTVHLMWRLHHEIALQHPKLGELVAFRNIVREIPRDTAVDEASIEAIIVGAGYTVRYVPDAIVRNKGPENVTDFLKQRRRIAAGHRHLVHNTSYKVSTMHPGHILRILMKEQRWNVRDVAWSLGAIGLEMAGRVLGYYDLTLKKRNPFIWDVAASTKAWNEDRPSGV